MRTLAGWCVGHRRLVVLFWFALLIGSIALVESVGTDYSNNFNFPHTQSFDAINLLKSVAPGRSGDSEQIVFGTSGDARVSDSDVGLRINKMIEQIKTLPGVSVVASPYDSAGSLVNTQNINSARTVGWIPVNFRQTTQQHHQRRSQALHGHRHGHLR